MSYVHIGGRAHGGCDVGGCAEAKAEAVRTACGARSHIPWLVWWASGRMPEDDTASQVLQAGEAAAMMGLGSQSGRPGGSSPEARLWRAVCNLLKLCALWRAVADSIVSHHTHSRCWATGCTDAATAAVRQQCVCGAMPRSSRRGLRCFLSGSEAPTRRGGLGRAHCLGTRASRVGDRCRHSGGGLRGSAVAQPRPRVTVWRTSVKGSDSGRQCGQPRPLAVDSVGRWRPLSDSGQWALSLCELWARPLVLRGPLVGSDARAAAFAQVLGRLHGVLPCKRPRVNLRYLAL